MNKKSIAIIIVIVVIIAIVGVAALLFKNENDSETNSSEDVEENFSVKYLGVEIVPGTEFRENQINEIAALSEIPSCAFEGTDKIYTYEGVEITVATIDGEDKVYEVYFIDETAETEEGVKITDNKELMLEKYGTDYKEEFGNKYTYTKGNVKLSFTVENNVITGITYTLSV